MADVPGLEWQDGVAILPGSDLKFRMNADGIMELVDENESKTNGDSVMCNGVASNGVSNNNEDKLESDQNATIESVNTSNEQINPSPTDDNEETPPIQPQIDDHVVEEMETENLLPKETPRIKEEAKIEPGETTKPNLDAKNITDETCIPKQEDLSKEIKTETSLIPVQQEPIVVKTEVQDQSFEPNDEISPVSEPLACKCCGKPTILTHFKGKFCSKQCLGRMLGRSYKNRKRLSTNQKSESSLPQPKKKRHSYPGPPPMAMALMTKQQSDLSQAYSDQQRPIQQMEPFNWPAYVLSQNSITVPVKTFQAVTGKDPFPTMNPDSSVVNGFEEGMLLEGVDPLHPEMICALSVAEVQGFRLRLHFINYSHSHDFWVNCDNTLIFPCHFCKKTDRVLQPPKDTPIDKFSWLRYSRKFHAPIAPDNLFAVNTQSFDANSKFVIGQYMEAHCSPTGQPSRVKIVDIIGDQIRVIFNERSYWFSDRSSLIHHCGWANENGVDLRPNSDIRGNVADCKKVPRSSFPELRQHEFVVGQKFEAVDPRNNILIRVATIADIDETRIKVHFDGWQDMYDFWMKAESPDIHPAGWCQSTGYPLQPPAGFTNDTTDEQSGCPIQGCSGIGHIKGSRYRIHHSEFGCPYSAQNLNRNPILDRLLIPKSLRKDKSRESKPAAAVNNSVKSSNHSQRRLSIQNTTRTKSPDPTNEVVAVRQSQRKIKAPIDDSSMQRAVHRSILVSNIASFPSSDLPMAWELHTNALPGVKGTHASEIFNWTIKKVSRYVKNLTGSEKIAQAFENEEIDGKSFLLLTQSTILQLLNIKLGPALKIYNAILMAKLNDIIV